MHLCNVSGDAVELLSMMNCSALISPRDSIESTLSDASIISALHPIKNNVKRFIDHNEKWAPIDYKYVADDTDWLEPKLSRPSSSNSRKAKVPRHRRTEPIQSIRTY
eukprot:UN10083